MLWQHIVLYRDVLWSSGSVCVLCWVMRDWFVLVCCLHCFWFTVIWSALVSSRSVVRIAMQCVRLRRAACLIIAVCPASNKSSLEIVKTGSLQYIRTLIQLEISIICVPSLSRTTRTHTHARAHTHTHTHLSFNLAEMSIGELEN